MSAARAAGRRGAIAACAPALALLLAVAASACNGSRAADLGAKGSGGANGPRAPGLSLGLALAADERSLDVEIRVTGPEAGKVRALRATRGWGDTHPLVGVRDLAVRDAEGPIEVGAAEDDGAFSVLPLARAARGDEVVVRYTARAGAEASRLALHRGAGGVSGVGHGFVVRPAISAELPLTVRFEARAAGSGAVLATSLEGRARATVEDVAEAVFVAGAARTEALPSGDRVTVALGAGMDGRGASKIVAAARAFAERTFGLGEADGGWSGPVSLFVIGERNAGTEHDGASTGGALAVWLDTARELDPAAKILVAHEAFHRVFGGVVKVGIEGYEATWFSEGFATHYARRALFELALIGAEAFAADVARIAGYGAGKGHGGDARGAEYGRGARYAATLDAAVRAASRGKRSLDDVVRALAAIARKTHGGPIDVETFRAAVAAEVGPPKERALWSGIRAKEPAPLPEDAFGPCFKRIVKTLVVADLGFDAQSLDGSPAIVRGTVPGSAAEKAGVRDGAIVLRSSVRAGEELDPASSVEIVLTDPKGKRRVSYRPARERKTEVFEPQACGAKESAAAAPRD